jgi:hypothetical protein
MNFLDIADSSVKIMEAIETSNLNEFSDMFQLSFKTDNFHPEDIIYIKCNIPAPTNCIINESALEIYQQLFRMNIRLRLALIGLQNIMLGYSGAKIGELQIVTTDACASHRLVFHLRVIISELISFVNYGVILPMRNEFIEKVKINLQTAFKWCQILFYSKCQVVFTISVSMKNFQL